MKIIFYGIVQGNVNTKKIVSINFEDARKWRWKRRIDKHQNALNVTRWRNIETASHFYSLREKLQNK